MRGQGDGEPEVFPVAPAPQTADDPVTAALQDLADAADHIAGIAALIREYMPRIRAGRARGDSYRALVARGPRPLIGAVLTEAVARFEAAGTRYRQVHGRALQQEGMSLQEIAGLWGLTRQRISELLQTADGLPDRRRALRPTTPAGPTGEPGTPAAPAP